MNMGWRAGLETIGWRCHILIMDARDQDAPHAPGSPAAAPEPSPVPLPKEIGGPKGPEPTRYGDWEYNGRCTDF